MNSAPAVKGFDLTPQARAQASELGRTFGVSPSLDECDHILGHLIVSRGNLENAVARYFAGGRQDADQILSLTRHLGLGPDAAILDFACGYGRISRHLGAVNLTCCDIHDSAVAFVARELGQRAFLSTFVPEEIAFPQKFDLIFVVSLFSHLPDALFGRWIAALTDALNPGGYLMFTTHGEAAIKASEGMARLVDAATGFGFAGLSEQRDIDAEFYGSAVALPAYVTRQIQNHTSADIVSFTPGAWWDWQDQWILRAAPANHPDAGKNWFGFIARALESLRKRAMPMSV